MRELIESGEDSAAEDGCAPDACEISALNALPNVEFWGWCDELTEWEAAGLPVASLIMRWPLPMVRAWVAMRLAFAEEMQRIKEVGSSWR